MDFAQFYQEGGVFMHPIFLLGLVSCAAGPLALLIRARAMSITAIVVGLLCLAIGLAGYLLGMVEVHSALQTVARDQYEMARERGTEIAMVPLYFGAAASAPGVLGGLLGLVLARFKRR